MSILLQIVLVSILLEKINLSTMNRIILFLILSLFIPKINAQEYFPNNESVQNKESEKNEPSDVSFDY